MKILKLINSERKSLMINAEKMCQYEAHDECMQTDLAGCVGNAEDVCYVYDYYGCEGFSYSGNKTLDICNRDYAGCIGSFNDQCTKDTDMYA